MLPVRGIMDFRRVSRVSRRRSGQISDGFAQPFARRPQLRRAGAGPQHLTGYRGQQLAGRRPTEAGKLLGAPALHSDARHQHRAAEGGQHRAV